MSQWQTLDTAPKDGRWVLIRANTLMGSVRAAFVPTWVFVAYWDGGWRQIDGGKLIAADEWEPTYWASLPEEKD